MTGDHGTRGPRDQRTGDHGTTDHGTKDQETRGTRAWPNLPKPNLGRTFKKKTGPDEVGGQKWLNEPRDPNREKAAAEG